MPLGIDYDRLNAIFDPINRTGGVLFPVFIPEPLDIDTASIEILGDYIFPFKVRLITVQAFCSTLFTTASINPIVGIAVGTSGVASAGLATEVSTITLTSPGVVGAAEVAPTRWAGSTTATTIDTTQSIWVYIKTAAAAGSYPSTAQDGAVRICLWLAQLNAPE